MISGDEDATIGGEYAFIGDEDAVTGNEGTFVRDGDASIGGRPQPSEASAQPALPPREHN
jgi:hypothetical protein